MDKLCSPATIDREPTEVLLLSRIGIIIKVPSLVISLHVSIGLIQYIYLPVSAVSSCDDPSALVNGSTANVGAQALKWLKLKIER
jgi:hypothetical protein